MEIIYIGLLTFIAATIGTLTGFGTSTIMIPVLALFLPPAEVIFLVAIIHWFGNVWKVALFREGFDARLWVFFGASGLAASYLGASISLGANEDTLLRLLGAFLAGYALFLIFEPKFKAPPTNAVAFVGGGLSGFFAGMFGIGGAIRSAFLSAFDLPKAVYIATAGAIGLLVDSTRILAYLAGGAALPRELRFGLLVFIPISFLGAYTAKNFVRKIPQKKFRLVIAAFLCAVGIRLILFT